MAELVEVYRTPNARACRHRALVLTSQSIPFLQREENGAHRLLVDAHWVVQASEQLRRYEEENRAFRLRRVLPPAAPLTGAGCVGFVVVLVLGASAQWGSAFDLDWHERGLAHAQAIRAGELWRAATALTLHADPPHLFSNVLFGLLFAYLLFHAHGGGLGALAMLAAGFLGNITNAWVQASEHLSLGASTAVFAAVGLLGGSEARTRHLLREPEARRVAPIGGALVLLLYLGLGEVGSQPRVDVMAHVFGLLWGLALGGLLAAIPRGTIERRGVQLACGLGALLLLALAWVIALPPR